MKSRKMIPTRKLDDFGKKILGELQKGEMTDKEIANSFKVDLYVVKTIKKNHFKAEDRQAVLIPKTTIKSETNSEKKDDIPKSSDSSPLKRGSKDRAKRSRISDEIKLSLICEIENNPSISTSKLKEMFGISIGSVYNILKEFGYDNSKKKIDGSGENVLEEKEIVSQTPENKPEEKETKPISGNDLTSIISNFVKATKKSTIIEAYIYEEIMETRDYVFGTDADNLSFHDLFTKACEWMEENVSKAHNKFNQKLCLYLSDNDLMNLALIKAAESKKVNLDIKLFDKKLNRFNTITMFHMFEMGQMDKSNIDIQLAQKHEIYLYGMKSSMDVKKIFYEIDLSEFDSRGKEKKRLFIFNNKIDAWQYFSAFIDIIYDSERSFEASLNEITVDESGKSIIKPLSKSM